MAAFVLDASVAISWRFPGDPTEDTPYCGFRGMPISVPN
jgi:hypothetical protein